MIDKGYSQHRLYSYGKIQTFKLQFITDRKTVGQDEKNAFFETKTIRSQKIFL